MGRALLSFVAALCACGCAMGEPPGPEEVEALGTALAEEDSGKLETARERLEALADAHPEELRPLLRHPDKEVSSRVRETLGKRGVFEDPVLTRQCAAYLAAISGTRDRSTRRELLRTLFALGREVREYVAWEFTDSRAVALPPKDSVVEGPGRPVPQVRHRNATRHGLWIDSRRYGTRIEGRTLAEGLGHWWPMKIGYRESGGGRLTGEGALACLSVFRRIPPGAEFEGAGYAICAQDLGEWRAELDPLYWGSGYSYEWDGTTLDDPPELPPAKSGTVLWVHEHADEEFVAISRPEPGDPTILMVETRGNQDWRWAGGTWLAISNEDRLIATGSISGIDTEQRETSSQRRLKLNGEIPLGTSRVWVSLTRPDGIVCIPARPPLVVTRLDWNSREK